jgi:hypothetical protein
MFGNSLPVALTTLRGRFFCPAFFMIGAIPGITS